MSYTLTLSCGCLVYVSCHPQTDTAHTRIIEQRGAACRERRHQRGTRLWLWELLPGVTADNSTHDVNRSDEWRNG